MLYDTFFYPIPYKINDKSLFASCQTNKKNQINSPKILLLNKSAI